MTTTTNIKIIKQNNCCSLRSCKLLLNIFKFLDWPCIMHPRSSKTVVWIRVDPGGVPTGGDGFADLGMRIAVVWIVELLELQAGCLWGANGHPLTSIYQVLSSLNPSLIHFATIQDIPKKIPKWSPQDPSLQTPKDLQIRNIESLHHACDIVWLIPNRFGFRNLIAGRRFSFSAAFWALFSWQMWSYKVQPALSHHG